MDLSLGMEDLRCLRVLSKHRVEYLVVGGHAVRFHGHIRSTKDLDVLVGNDHGNSVRLCAALTEILGVAHPNITPEQIEGRKRQVNFEQWGLKFEVLTAADGIDFNQAYARRSISEVGALKVPVISKQDLIVMKKTAARPQDLSDVSELEIG